MNWPDMLRTAAMRQELLVAEQRRRDHINAEMLAFQQGKPLCALCLHILGYGPDCYRCARFS